MVIEGAASAPDGTTNTERMAIKAASRSLFIGWEWELRFVVIDVKMSFGRLFMLGISPPRLAAAEIAPAIADR